MNSLTALLLTLVLKLATCHLYKMLNVEKPTVEHDTLNIEHQTVKQLAALAMALTLVLTIANWLYSVQTQDQCKQII